MRANAPPRVEAACPSPPRARSGGPDPGPAQDLAAAPKRGLAQWMTCTVQRSGAASASVPASAPRVSASMPAKGGNSITKPVLAALT